MSNAVDLLIARAAMVAWGDGTLIETVGYLKANRLNWSNVNAFAGCLVLGNVHFLASGRFVFADDGQPAAIIEVIDYDALNNPRVLDLVAWSIDEPSFFATAVGQAEALGSFNVSNPATYFAGSHLKAHRSPLAWLQGGCSGVCILNSEAAPNVLGGALGPIVAEDEQHARSLHGATQGLPRRPRIGFPAAPRLMEVA